MRVSQSQTVLKMVSLAIIVTAAFYPLPAIAAEPPRAAVSRAELPYLPPVEAFLNAVERADIGTAVDALQWPEEPSSKLKQELAKAATSLGKSDGHEIVGVRRLTPRLHQLYCVIHYEKEPLLFVLHPRLFRGQWRIQTVTYAAGLKGLDELAPLERVAPESGDRVAARPAQVENGSATAYHQRLPADG